MNDAEVRSAWLQRLSEDVARAIENKQSGDALVAVAARYRSLPLQERVIVHQLLADQLASQDETVRFLALALIDDFRITSALPALRRLADWLERQRSPGAPYEWAKVNRIIGQLSIGGN